MKKLLGILIMLCVSFTYAQKERSLKLDKKTDLIEVVRKLTSKFRREKGSFKMSFFGLIGLLVFMSSSSKSLFLVQSLKLMYGNCS